MTEPVQNTPARFRGPHSGIVATVFVVLFLAGLMPVTAFGGMPYFPGPTASVNEMVAFFSQRQAGNLAVRLSSVRLCGSTWHLHDVDGGAAEVLRRERPPVRISPSSVG